MPSCAPWPKAPSQRTGANVGLAVSGIAGPGGAVPGKPVGTVWFALAYKQEDRLECQGHLIQFDGNRDAVRRQAVEYALKLLRALPQPRLNMLRLFFALQPTLEQNTALTAHVAPLVAQLEAQPVPAQNLHATLCFIGADRRGAGRCVARRGSEHSWPAGEAAVRRARILGDAENSVRDVFPGFVGGE